MNRKLQTNPKVTVSWSVTRTLHSDSRRAGVLPGDDT